jgi:hypothetical protein
MGSDQPGTNPIGEAERHRRARQPLRRRPTVLAGGLAIVGIALLGSQPWLGGTFVLAGAAGAAGAAVIGARRR